MKTTLNLKRYISVSRNFSVFLHAKLKKLCLQQNKKKKPSTNTNTQFLKPQYFFHHFYEIHRYFSTQAHYNRSKMMKQSEMTVVLLKFEFF